MTSHLLKITTNPTSFCSAYHVAWQLSDLCSNICVAASHHSHLHGDSGAVSTCSAHVTHVCLKQALAITTLSHALALHLCADLRHGQQSIRGSHPWHGNSGGTGCLHPSGQQPGMCSSITNPHVDSTPDGFLLMPLHAYLGNIHILQRLVMTTCICMMDSAALWFAVQPCSNPKQPCRLETLCTSCFVAETLSLGLLLSPCHYRSHSHCIGIVL